MSEILAVVVMAVMFVGFGMFHRYGMEHRGCGACHDNESVDRCGECPLVGDISESSHE
ncbi:MAG: hypothetical protein IIB90_10975 [Gemmatimonadetes bacterium]|nr:hypothetical protein [Gemmatimonadota bacterium]